MIHPVAVAALVVLILNDQYLKPAYGNAVTGKLSDVAGLVVAPLVMLAAFDFATALRRRPQHPLGRVFPGILAIVGLGFTLIQLSGAASELYEGTLSTVSVPSQNYQDPTDVLALPALVIAWFTAAATDRSAAAAVPHTSRPLR